MALSPSPVSQFLLVLAFLAVSSSAGLHWIGMSAQTEASRQQASRQTLAEFTAQLNRMETAPEAEKPKLAENLAGMAERFASEAKRESLASGSRRVVALASWEAERQTRDRELQERLKAEVRGLVNETESLESAALRRASWLGTVNQALLAGAAILCGFLALWSQRDGLAR